MIQEITKKEALVEQKNSCLREIIKQEIDIHTLERTDPNTVIERKNKMGRSGEIIATIDITAKESIETRKKQLTGVNIRLNSIEALLGKEDEK